MACLPTSEFESILTGTLGTGQSKLLKLSLHMCEWLSSSEWCDVKLVCGGRTFNAHRAVLASRVLLSCSQEDNAFIVLPEFDLEAMSSVLYYVYNGEVLIEQRKLLMFLDIVKTLEIFIDQQYLEKIHYSIDSRYLDILKYPKSILLANELSSKNIKEHECMNTEKVEMMQDKLQYSLSDSDLTDKSDRCYSHSEQHPSTPYLDRQRSSFLRDLYIETYPQNGNVNGLTEGVRAISNERYRAPTSVLLTNANSELPTGADRLTESSNKLAERDFLPNIFRKQSCVKGFDQAYNGISTKSFFETAQWTSLGLPKCKLFMESGYNYDLRISNSQHVINYKQTNSNTQFQGDMQEKIPSSSLDLSFTRFVRSVVSNSFNDKNKYLDKIDVTESNVSGINREYDIKAKCTNLYKVPIFNQVIDSPWRPRLPNNYKPFRRKGTYVTDTAPNKKENFTVVNDSNNNNVEQTTEIAFVTHNTADTQEHRCPMCNQVFSDDGSLKVHMKRHTSTARYSCSECGKTFSQLRNFKYHVSVHRGTREFAATCTVCGKYFNDRGYLSSHMKIHRNRKEYKCSLCPKSFNQRVAYNMHVRIHTGVKPHVCDECGKAFSRKMLLKQHQRTHSGERPYACSHCDKRFADSNACVVFRRVSEGTGGPTPLYSLPSTPQPFPPYDHIRPSKTGSALVAPLVLQVSMGDGNHLQSGVKPFSCSLCPKSFTKKHHLKSHLNFHTGAKPYSCPRCNLAFTQSSNMRTHMKKCTAISESNN
ncbi:unnamed protein product [Diatraea saccharalis]|uniref:Uncharacterized protein n=1 Tax=Diatraea saccharalis TaxID=40085 RepID=A0A9N9WA11_9NEOP|nr:unnamed protein product [Diatraea saccharalis]